ncbi:unnamed protein product [Boreogadus saida]
MTCPALNMKCGPLAGDGAGLRRPSGVVYPGRGEGSSAASCACAARKSFGSVRVVVRAAPAAGLQTADRFCRVGTKRSGGHKQERMKGAGTAGVRDVRGLAGDADLEHEVKKRR